MILQSRFLSGLMTGHHVTASNPTSGHRVPDNRRPTGTQRNAGQDQDMTVIATLWIVPPLKNQDENALRAV